MFNKPKKDLLYEYTHKRLKKKTIGNSSSIHTYKQLFLVPISLDPINQLLICSNFDVNLARLI